MDMFDIGLCCALYTLLSLAIGINGYARHKKAPWRNRNQWWG